MAILRKALVVLVVLVVAFLVIGLLLPSTARVERSTMIDASPATVFAAVNDLRRFNEWSPWAARDPEAEYTYEGPASGIGAKMSWQSSELGSGSQEITASEPNERVETVLDFGPEGTASGYYHLEPEGEGTKITWGFEVDFGRDLVDRYFGLMLDRWVGADYEEGLASLKAYAEALPAAPEIAMVEVEPMDIVYVSGRTTHDEEEIAAALGSAYGRVMAFLAGCELQPAGPPRAIATEWSEEENLYAFEAAIPVTGTAPKEMPADVHKGSSYGGKAVRAVHIGSYRELGPTYEALEAFLAAEGLSAAGPPWEEYLSDPGETPEEELITHVYFPVQ